MPSRAVPARASPEPSPYPSVENVFDTLSGTHGLTGVFDTLMALGRHGVGAKLVAQGRDLEPYEKALERDQRTGGWQFKGEAVPRAKTGERQELLVVPTGADAAMMLGDLAQAIGKPRDTTRRLLEGLVAEGLISQPRHGAYALIPPQFPQFDSTVFRPN